MPVKTSAAAEDLLANKFPATDGANHHFVQFFESDTSLVQSVAHYAMLGLKTDAAVVVIATADHIQAIEESLAAHGFHLEERKQIEQFVFLDAEKTLATFMVEGKPDRDLFNEHVGKLMRELSSRFQKVFAYGEMVGLLWKEANRSGTVALEQLWNHLCKKHDFTLFCGYSLKAFQDSKDLCAFSEIRKEHSHVLPSDEFLNFQNNDDQLRAIALLQQQALALSAELKRREKAEAELRDFFDNSVMALHWVGPDGIILRANQAELKLLGYSENEYIGHHIAEFHADAEAIQDILTCLTGGKSIHSYPARLKAKDGSIRHVLIDSNVYFENEKFIHTRCFTRDVTEQVKAETAYRESETLMNLIIKNSRDCIKVLGLDAKILFMNEGGLQITEICEFEAIRGACWLDFWEGKTKEEAVQAFGAASVGGTKEFIAFAPTAKTKTPKWWNISLSPMVDDCGEIKQILCVSRDISEQIKAQEILNNAEKLKQDEKFRLIVESVKDYAIFMLDVNGNIATWNEGAKRIKGYTADEIIGKHFSVFYPREIQAKKFPEWELQVAAKEGRFEDEGWRIRKDGTQFWANIVITALHEPDGKLVGFAKVSRDLTERKRAENELREAGERFEKQAKMFDTALSSSPDFYYIFDVNHRFTYVNQSLLKLWGMTLDQAIGKNFAELGFPIELVELHRAQLDEVLSTKQLVRGENVFTSSDGKTGYYQYIFIPILDNGGNIQAISGTTRDVTEMKKLEQTRLEEQRRALLLEQLERSKAAIEIERENFRNLFKQTPEMVCILKGPEHIFEFTNEAHVKVLGFDATGKTVREAQPESIEVHGILDEVYLTGKTAELHEIPVTVTNRLRYFNLTYAARRDQAGNIDGIMILGAEVTEQVQGRKLLKDSAQQLELAVKERTRELEASQGFLHSVIENIPHMVFIKDANDLRFVSFNRAGEELLGFSRDELIGKNDHDFFPAEQAQHFVSKDREVLAGRKVVDIPDESIETKYKGQRILRTRKIPIIGTDGVPVYLLGVSEDITAWKRAEEDRLKFIREEAAIEERKRENERASFLAEASTILASSLDYHQTLKELARLAVPSLADWCTVTIIKEDRTKERVAAIHYDPSKNALIDELSNYHPISADEDAGIGRVIKTGESLFTPRVEDSHLVAAAKDERHLKIMRDLVCHSCIVSPIFARGKVLGAISIVSGCNDRIYNENDLATVEELGRRAGIAIDNAFLYEAAQKAIQARDEFMSIASHELKTPLTTLYLQTQIRQREVKKGEYRRFTPEKLPQILSDDEKQICRLTRLVDDMLDISRVQTGKLSFSYEEFDLCDLIQDVLSRFSAQIEAHGCPVTLNSNIRAVGVWDRFRIEQVFINLLTNALKYGAGNQIEVQVATEDARVKLSVSDQGMGIDERDQQRIFDQFERAVDSNNISGLGLGLYISKKIVEAHQGTISVKSKPGKGSVFTVELPLSATSTGLSTDTQLVDNPQWVTRVQINE